MKTKESLDSKGRMKGGTDGAGVGSGLSENMQFSTDRPYGDGELMDDNAMSSGGRAGYARAVKKHTSGNAGGFPMDGGTK